MASATELRVLDPAPSGAELVPVPHGGVEQRALEITAGFPSTGHHVIHPTPTLGYGGAVAFGQPLINAMLRRRVGR